MRTIYAALRHSTRLSGSVPVLVTVLPTMSTTFHQKSRECPTRDHCRTLVPQYPGSKLLYDSLAAGPRMPTHIPPLYHFDSGKTTWEKYRG